MTAGGRGAGGGRACARAADPAPVPGRQSRGAVPSVPCPGRVSGDRLIAGR